MEGIIYVNLIEIGLVVIETQGVKNGELAIPVIIHLCTTWLFWLLKHDCVS